MSKYDYDKYDYDKANAADNKSASNSADFTTGRSAIDSYDAFKVNSCTDNCTADTCHSLQGVNCEATGCRYHHPGGQCSAAGIKVESPDADNKTDTFCNTFTPNSGY